MSYFSWFVSHGHKHTTLVHKLIALGYTKECIIDYFVFENMAEQEPSFCLLYANKQKCHPVSYLNCYLCACPHFRFNDDGLTTEKNLVIKSQCSITSKKSAWFVHENVAHLDCSRCSLPHTKAFIRKHFDRDWREIMKECFTSPKACEKQ